MKIYRFHALNPDAETSTIRSYTVLHDDGRQHDDLQTLLASLMRYRKRSDYWLWDDNDHLTFDDGTRILL